jgi:hypothetical protein
MDIMFLLKIIRYYLNGFENKLRKFQKQLRHNGIRWVREPRWSMLRHNLAVVDFRLAIESSVSQLSLYTLANWIVESEFRSKMDKVTVVDP